ncbi:hypothetical protein [Roseovarius sp. MBR-6]|jgi:hypothetical protein|uniref:hypothetical protein n=1 Tax=Roseovarius sp. MBR-6 TaxID=3156459 RepID=UPI003392890A
MDDFYHSVLRETLAALLEGGHRDLYWTTSGHIGIGETRLGIYLVHDLIGHDKLVDYLDELREEIGRQMEELERRNTSKAA